jgi:hypothetical protein
MLKTLTAIRYVTPLREGGSLPAVVEADDGELYVVKFLGAGQGARALVAELVVGELARACGLHVPAIARIELDGAFGRNERDPEIRDLLRASAGTNLGLAYLPGAIAYDPIAPPAVDETAASAVVWLDALTLNVDRSPRNPNLLLWEGALWLIDHGAALYFHHAWPTAPQHVSGRFPQVREHVLLRHATRLAQAHAELGPKVLAALDAGLLAEVPDAWLAPVQGVGDAAALRAAYAAWLRARLEAATAFLEEAAHARSQLV